MATQSMTTSLAQPYTETALGMTAIAEVVSARVARLGDRFLGLLIDSVPLTGLSFVLASCCARLKVVGLAGFPVTSAAAWLPYAFFFVISFVYFSVLEGTCGCTLGKALVGIRVQSMNGAKCDMRASLIRNLFRLIDGQIMYLFAFFVASFSRSRQRLGDHLADTVVVERDLPTSWRLLVVTLWTLLTTMTVYGSYVMHASFPHFVIGG